MNLFFFLVCISCHYSLPCSCTHLSGCRMSWVLSFFGHVFERWRPLLPYTCVRTSWWHRILSFFLFWGNMPLVAQDRRKHVVHQELYFSKLYFWYGTWTILSAGSHHMEVCQQPYLAIQLSMCILFLCPCWWPVVVLLTIERIGCPSVWLLMYAILHHNKYRIKALNRAFFFLSLLGYTCTSKCCRHFFFCSLLYVPFLRASKCNEMFCSMRELLLGS